MREGNEGGQLDQAPEGGVPSVGPGRGDKPLTWVDGPKKKTRQGCPTGVHHVGEGVVG